MEYRGRAYRRHHRRRVIHNRLEHKRLVWFRNHRDWFDENRERMAAGLAKWNLVCSCGLCTMGKREGKRRERHEARLALGKEVAIL